MEKVIALCILIFSVVNVGLSVFAAATAPLEDVPVYAIALSFWLVAACAATVWFLSVIWRTK